MTKVNLDNVDEVVVARPPSKEENQENIRWEDGEHEEKSLLSTIGLMIDGTILQVACSQP